MPFLETPEGDGSLVVGYLINDPKDREILQHKLKQLNAKFKPNEIISIKYINKKDHELLKHVKIKRVE